MTGTAHFIYAPMSTDEVLIQFLDLTIPSEIE